MTISSLAQLHAVDLDKCVAVATSLVLPDGSGLEALAYVHGVRPELGVILVGDSDIEEMALEALAAGATDFLPLHDPYVRGFRHAVIRAIAQQRVRWENERLHRELSQSVAELALANEQLQQMIVQLELAVRTDELTGLGNRRWLSLRLETEWAESSRFGLPLAFMMIDLDGFKQFNDSLGHQQGDEMLRTAARIIRANCREVDVVARYGGDEFCVLMTNTPADEAIQVAQRILDACESISQRASSHPRLNMSIGLSHNMISGPAGPDQLVTHADEALYAAKWAGKHRAVLYPGPQKLETSVSE
ncbi:MAG TPA: diguanylate cyclase [Phycisphaerales bacterium]|nr:diguanylate cyclase [Phycisphaerales bacterium]